MSEVAVVDLDLARLVGLERRIGAYETNGLRARWEFGHELLRARDGKGRLPNGYLAKVRETTGVSVTELTKRQQFAERFASEDELRNAVTKFGSWHAIVNEALAKQKPAPIFEAVKAPDGTFATIVADPPWKYDNKATRGAAEDHYPTMTVDALCELPVKDWAADQAHLYLWTTNGFLRESFSILDAWGFEYKTTLVWAKPQIGMGNYFRSSTEYALFGIRGGLRTLDCNQRNWFEAPRGRHSAKPHKFFDLVEMVSPGPHLEMFARPDRQAEMVPRRKYEWAYWGNEVNEA